MITELPDGWSIIRVSDYFDSWGGMTPSTSNSSYWGGNVPWLSSKDIKTLRITAGEEFITRKALQETRLRLCPAGTVVIVVRSGILAHTLPIAVVDAPVSINQDLKAFLSPDTGLNEWLALALRALSPEILSENRKDGTTVQSIRYEELCDLKIPVPPRGEQRRIAARVVQLSEKVENTKQRLSRIPAILKRFRQSMLAAACSGRLTADWREQHPQATVVFAKSDGPAKTRRGVPARVECPNDLAEFEIPPSWALKSVADLLMLGTLKDIKDGNHGSNHPKTAELGDHGLPFITAAQVKNYKIDYESAPKITGQPLKRLKVGFAEKGDVILTHKGTVGRAAVNTKPCVLTPQTTYYRCDPEVLDPAYLVHLLNSPFFYSQLAAVMSQTTRDFVPISEQYRLFLILPPVEEQREIGRRLGLLLDAADKVQQAFQDATARTDRLTQSVLAKAFRGELVPTEAELARREGREYEPASVLLERIRAERENQVKSLQVSKHKSQRSTTLVGA